MTEPLRTPTHSRHSTELELQAANRKLRWFSAAFAAATVALSSFAIFLVVSGVRASRGMSDLPRPNVGPGLSEAATQYFGSLMVSAWFGVPAVATLAIALITSLKRKRTLFAAIPVFLYFMLVYAETRWRLL